MGTEDIEKDFWNGVAPSVVINLVNFNSGIAYIIPTLTVIDPGKKGHQDDNNKETYKNHHPNLKQ